MEWNTAKKIWQHSTDAHLFALWEPWLETWPTSGMTVNGRVYELPTPERHTTDSEFLSSPILPTPTTQDSSGICRDHGGDLLHDVICGCSRSERRELLRTPTASQGEGGALGEEEAKRRGNTVGIRDQAMDIAALNGEKVSRNEINLMPTPVAQEGAKAPAQQTSAVKGKTGQVWLSNVAKDLEPKLGTPQARDYKGRPGREEDKNLNHDVARHDLLTNWGKFEPAIRRWEEVLDRDAPSPTKPDGKEGAHRLSSAFTEWLMGLPEGWVTDVGLTRNEELKACGNGVVPQQAATALRALLHGLPIASGGGQVNFPTPTVSDTFTDNLKSSQQKPGSMHSVTLPQAVRMVGEIASN